MHLDFRMDIKKKQIDQTSINRKCMYSIIGNQFKKPSGILGMFISRIMEKGNAIAYKKLFENIELEPGDKVLEIGFGHGLGIQYITENHDPILVDGIDFSKLMYNKAYRKFLPKINQGFINLYFGDFIKGDIPKKYDKIFCINVIYFWQDLAEPFMKIKSMLKPGGMFCIYMSDKEELDKHPFTKENIFNKYSLEEVLSSLTKLGYANEFIKLETGAIVKACI